MRIDYRIVIILIFAALAIQYFLSSEEPVEDVVVVIDEKKGEVQKKLDEIVRDTIYIEVPSKDTQLPERKQIVVDSTYKAEYETAIKENDSLKAKNLFLESIELDTYEGTMVDDDDIRIKGKFLTRGKLLEYKIDYTIKSDTIKYTPEVVTRFPKLSIVGGIDLSMPIQYGVEMPPVISAHLGIRNKKGNTISFGVDTQNRFTVGYEITLFKTKK